MDKYAEIYYGKDELLEMSRKLAEWYNRFDNDALAIDSLRAEDIMNKARFGKNSLPRQINNATLQREVHNG
jgi:hypothetical protein